ncbi:MAG: hypothetical protein ACO24H_10585 [Polynucleobacter sp.]
MATLSLNRAKPIGETPLENLANKFVVMRQSRSSKSFRFTCIHETQAFAMREAKRLQIMYPTERFLILQVQGWADWSA